MNFKTNGKQLPSGILLFVVVVNKIWCFLNDDSDNHISKSEILAMMTQHVIIVTQAQYQDRFTRASVVERAH